MSAAVNGPRNIVALSLVRSAFEYTRGDRPAFLFAHLVSAFAGALKMVYPLLIGALMNDLQRHGVANLADLQLTFLMVVALLTFLWAIRVPLKLLQFRVARRAQNAMVSDMNRRLFAAPLSWHEERHSGDTATRVQQSSGAVYNFTLSNYMTVENIIQIICPIVALAFLSPAVLVGSIVGFVIVGAISFGGDKYQTPLWTKEADARRVFGTTLVDGYRNITTMYATRRRSAFAIFAESKLKDIFAIARRNIVFAEVKGAAIEVVATAFSLGLVVLYIFLATQGEAGSPGYISLGNVYMVQTYVMSGTVAMVGLVANVSDIMRQRADFVTAAPLYEVEPEPECSDRLDDRWSRLVVHGLEVTYVGKDCTKRALHSMDMTLLRGQHYALVGANGSGKTTLLKLLSGLLRPDGGSLIVDGTALDFGALRNAATLIPQHPELLEGTLEHNLLMGACDGAVADEVAKSRVVSDLISRLGVNLLSRVQEAGANWSGGQRQRIALARGILAAKGSSLILVDEPTSSIDPAEERYIINQLRTEFRDECMLMSVHNLELVRDFDTVIVLENGALLDAGPPETVCARCSYFLPEEYGRGQEEHAHLS